MIPRPAVYETAALPLSYTGKILLNPPAVRQASLPLTVGFPVPPAKRSGIRPGRSSDQLPGLSANGGNDRDSTCDLAGVNGLLLR